MKTITIKRWAAAMLLLIFTNASAWAYECDEDYADCEFTQVPVKVILNEVEITDCEVAAFDADGNCRGTSTTNNGSIFLPIYGDENFTVHFRVVYTDSQGQKQDVPAAPTIQFNRIGYETFTSDHPLTINLDEPSGNNAQPYLVASSGNTNLRSFVANVAGELTYSTVYEFAGISGSTVYGIPVANGTIEAGKPYMFKPTDENVEVNFIPTKIGYNEVYKTTAIAGNYGMRGVLETEATEEYQNTPCKEVVGDSYIVFQGGMLKNANSKGNYIAVGKCYIDNTNKQAFLPAPNQAPAHARAIGSYPDSEAGGIEEATVADGSAIGQAYNLQGLRTNDNYRGIIIKNGKKTLKK